MTDDELDRLESCVEQEIPYREPREQFMLVLAETRRARESEARLAKSLQRLHRWIQPGVTFGDPDADKAAAAEALRLAGLPLKS